MMRCLKMKMSSELFRLSAIVLASLAVVVPGCGGGDADGKLTSKTPREAASGLETAFSGESVEARQTVSAAASAMKSGDYEKAALSLGAIRASGSLTPQQGIAVHSSMVSLEEQLVHGVEAGDPKARQAYEILKRMKKK